MSIKIELKHRVGGVGAEKLRAPDFVMERAPDFLEFSAPQKIERQDACRDAPNSRTECLQEDAECPSREGTEFSTGSTTPSRSVSMYLMPGCALMFIGAAAAYSSMCSNFLFNPF